MTRLLASWIGHTDLRAMAPDMPTPIRDEIAKIVDSVDPPKGGLGPVRTVLEADLFDRVVLLSNYPRSLNELYAKWLGRPVEVRHVDLPDPRDYVRIFATVDEVLRETTGVGEGRRRRGNQARTSDRVSLFFLLSPGTPAMAAIWVLLGKTKYPARFYQAFEGRAWETVIPFDLTVDFVPELLRGADRALRRLASFSPQDIEGFERIIGESTAIRLAVDRARKAGIRDIPVLITGESGTGKEMFARAIHSVSHRRDKPFLAVNCAAIPGNLMESELFGHEKGAFTGADQKVDGAFKRAHGGTIFLDEIGELSPDLQAKLLRVLQPPLDADHSPCLCEFFPIGAARPVRSDVRVVAATNRNLEAMIQSTGFRSDLYYRVAVITIKLPPLRDRRADIPVIAEALLVRINEDFGRREPGYRPKSLSRSAMSLISKHGWPGNVRELRNALVQAAVMSEEDEIGVEDLKAAITELPAGPHPPGIGGVSLGDGFSLEEHVDGIRRHFIESAMRESGGVKATAARLLGLSCYQVLDGQIKRLGIPWVKP